MTRPIRSLILLLTSCALTAAAEAAPRFDARQAMTQATTLLKAGEYELARSHLAPALIHYRLAPAERSHGYYLRGMSFVAEQLYVSARKDFNRALEFNADNAAAQSALGDLYARGLGVEQDVPLALSLFSNAAELGDVRARFHLGRAYLNGIGVTRDVAEGREWLTQAAEAGSSTAMVHLGASYRAARSDEPDPQAALRWYEQAIALDDPAALVAKAYMLKDGELGEKDPATARALLEQASALGSDSAMVALSHLYLAGEGVAEDPEKAFALLTEAAAFGSPEVLFRLGHLHQYGLGTVADRTAALRAYERAAQAGSRAAMSRLAHLLMADSATAAQQRASYWLARAAEQNTAVALNDYAWLLATSPSAKVRDGELAVSQAQAAVAKDNRADFLDTLATAYAESGDFESAVRTQRQALAQAVGRDAKLIAELEARLKLFEAGKPWHRPHERSNAH